MSTLILDRELERRLRMERAAIDADRYDEVWQGVYVMSPMPNNEHQHLATRFAAIFLDGLGWSGAAEVHAGCNVSDRTDDWRVNYRIPDVAVFLKGGQAKNCGAFWYGGPDFAVEIVSEDDKTFEKLPFYEQVQVRELLVVEREPWRLQLFRLQDGRFERVGESTPENREVITSQVVPFSFCLIPGDVRPRIRVIHTETGRTWLV